MKWLDCRQYKWLPSFDSFRSRTWWKGLFMMSKVFGLLWSSSSFKILVQSSKPTRHTPSYEFGGKHMPLGTQSWIVLALTMLQSYSSQYLIYFWLVPAAKHKSLGLNCKHTAFPAPPILSYFIIWFFVVSQKRIVPSRAPDAIIFESGLISTQVICSWCPLNVLTA